MNPSVSSSQIAPIEIALQSAFLNREVIVTVLLPLGFSDAENYPLVLFNDGQDFGRCEWPKRLLPCNQQRR